VFEAEILTLAQSVLDACRARSWRVVTAESCTGGLVAGALTAIAGSSDVVERGFVTYSNGAKTELLGVPPETIDTHGAVSNETAAAAAEGAVARAPVDLAISVIGVASPGGGSVAEPVGLVIFGWRNAMDQPAPSAASSTETARQCARRLCGWRSACSPLKRTTERGDHHERCGDGGQP
jgi:nicotinamide-nucleotide amidase